MTIELSPELMEALTKLQSFHKDPEPGFMRSMLKYGKRIADQWHKKANETDDPWHHEMAHKTHTAVATHYRTIADMASQRGLERIAKVARRQANDFDERGATHLRHKGGNA